MTDDKLLQLAERCEKATGPDRELDIDYVIGFIIFALIAQFILRRIGVK